MWDEIYDRIVQLSEEHRSTLVFVNTRRLVERVAHNLAERIGEENVGAHHGSLSRRLRLEAERKLKEGKIKVLIATASLELGIDIGTVDLVFRSARRARSQSRCNGLDALVTGVARFPRAACSLLLETICWSARRWFVPFARVISIA